MATDGDRLNGADGRVRNACRPPLTPRSLAADGLAPWPIVTFIRWEAGL